MRGQLWPLEELYFLLFFLLFQPFAASFVPTAARLSGRGIAGEEKALRWFWMLCSAPRGLASGLGVGENVLGGGCWEGLPTEAALLEHQHGYPAEGWASSRWEEAGSGTRLLFTGQSGFCFVLSCITSPPSPKPAFPRPPQPLPVVTS